MICKWNAKKWEEMYYSILTWNNGDRIKSDFYNHCDKVLFYSHELNENKVNLDCKI